MNVLYSFRSSSLSGFTLVEALISLGILSIVAAIGFGSGIDEYERALARAHTTSVLWNILQARADAMHGICTGSSCTAGTSHDASLDSSHVASFSALSALVASPQAITFVTGSTSDIFNVNEEGRVSLTP